jgi:hypothetical protein
VTHLVLEHCIYLIHHQQHSVKHFISEIQGVSNGTPNYSWHPFVAGYGNTIRAINAVRFSINSGNIDDGTIQMFGIL